MHALMAAGQAGLLVWSFAATCFFFFFCCICMLILQKRKKRSPDEPSGLRPTELAA
jgi:preprotein translocase subunit SecG